jgi:hypothetical protein
MKFRAVFNVQETLCAAHLVVPDCGSHYGNVLEPEHTGSKRSGE